MKLYKNIIIIIVYYKTSYYSFFQVLEWDLTVV